MAECGFDPIRCELGILMLPDPHNRPTLLAEGPLGCSVAPYRRLQLRPPPLPVAFRQDAVFGAAVPEAAVHVNSDSCPAKDDVGASPERGVGSDINPVAPP